MSNKDVEIGIIVPLKKGAPVETSLLTNHWNSMGAAVPQSTTKKIRKKKKFCSWTICSIRFDYSPPSSERIHSIYSLVFAPRSDECVQKKDFLRSRPAREECI
jgi:hypothetical protein